MVQCAAMLCTKVSRSILFLHGVDREEIKDHDYNNNFKYEYDLYLKDPKR